MMWLTVCFCWFVLLNTMGYCWLNSVGQGRWIGLRRAQSVPQKRSCLSSIYWSACIGLLGGIVGLGLEFLGLPRGEKPVWDFIDILATLDTTMVIRPLLLAVVSSVLAGLYPHMRACNIAPASQLKSSKESPCLLLIITQKNHRSME